MVKALTLGTWGLDSEFSPIAISDISGISSGPFFAAVESRNYDLARKIVQIATVQHIDFRTNEIHSNQILGVDVCSVLADDVHSVETVKGLWTQVKSTTTPKKIVLDSNACLSAEKMKDMEMLKFAIDIESCFAIEQGDIDRRTRHAWNLVERSDWPNALEEYIRATGAPFKHVVVHGKLKVKKQLDRFHQMSPLLYAARSGNLEMVRFFLGKERAMAAYRDFAASNQFEIRKGSIEQSRNEFLYAVEKWMDHRSKYPPLLNCGRTKAFINHFILAHLILHSAIVSRNMDLVKFLVSTHPELLELRSVDGWTPLLVAACGCRIEALQILLEAGAHPLATDPLGRNMLHLLLVSPSGSMGLFDSNLLSSFLWSMDSSTLQQLLGQRCAESPGGLTPFARWVYGIRAVGFARPEPNILFTTVLELSNATMLQILDGAGCTPLHIVHRSFH